MDSFYRNYHATNPFLPPRVCLAHFGAAHPSGLRHLLAATQWIGSLYMPSGAGAGEQFFAEASRLASAAVDGLDGLDKHAAPPVDGWLLQTLLLLALGLDLVAQPDHARAVFARAETVMAHVALAHRPFGASHGQASNIRHDSGNTMLLDECWSRTCMAYFGLGVMLGVQQQQQQPDGQVEDDVLSSPYVLDHTTTPPPPPPPQPMFLDQQAWTGLAQPRVSFSDPAVILGDHFSSNYFAV
jgi:hypothetical protein